MSINIMTSDSSNNRTSEPSTGSEVVFFKDNIGTHPEQYTSKRINGRLRLIKHGSSLFLTWRPYRHSPDEVNCTACDSDLIYSEKDRILYTVMVPLSDVHAIRRHTPILGWQYVVIILLSGLAYPPLYFYIGGVREFLTILKQHLFLIRSSDDPYVFLVINDSKDRFEKSLSSFGLPRFSSLGGSSFQKSAISINNNNNSDITQISEYNDLGNRYIPSEKEDNNNNKGPYLNKCIRG